MQARPLPPQKYLHECFDYVPVTGELHWRERPISHFHDNKVISKHGRKRTAESHQRAWNAAFAGKPFGHKQPDGYLVGALNNLNYSAQRIIFKWMTDREPIQIDHRDRDKENNRWQNLRAATVAQNKANSGISARNQCGWKGVNARRGRFCARIVINGKYKHLGVFDTAEEANAAYFKMAQATWGEFASAH